MLGLCGVTSHSSVFGDFVINLLHGINFEGDRSVIAYFLKSDSIRKQIRKTTFFNG